MSDQELVVEEPVAEATAPEADQGVEPTPAAAEETQPAASESADTAEEASAEPSATSSEETAPGDDSGELTIHTLKPGQQLQGKVKNITTFGAFVDFGLPQDGLVHISELAKQKVEKVTDVVNVGDQVDVWVKKVDRKRGRISLTMIKPVSLRLKDIAEDDELEGVVTRLEPYGAFVDIGSGRDGLVHISQITHDYIKSPEEALAVGDTVKVKVLKVNRKKRQVDLSIKALLAPPPKPVVEEAPRAHSAPKAEEPVEELIEEEPTPTAMALAYAAAMQSKEDGDASEKENQVAKAKDKRKKEIDDIVARTLATTE